jgi:N utilization substance protein A
MSSELISAIKQVCEEKKLDYDTVVATIELALAAAYRKDFGEKNQNIKVKFDPETMRSQIFDVKAVVDDLPEEPETPAEEAEKPVEKPAKKTSKKKVEVVEAPVEIKADDFKEERRFNPKTEIQLKDAKLIKGKIKVGEEVVLSLPEPENYGRMAAQTAKQVIIQKLREVERDMVFNEFKDHEKQVMVGIVQRQEGRFVLVDLGKAIGCLPAEEQIPSEHYAPGDRIKVYVKEVRSGYKGAEIVLSRRSEEILRKIFFNEIPEIANGLVQLKSVAREAGSRSKVAIATDSDNIDPVGSCVGQRGARIQTIINELGGEKVDIIEYDEDPAKFIGNALSPAKISEISLDNTEHKATVKVSPDKLSLAIGKNGQNVRLAAKLTGWKIDILPFEGAQPAAEAAISTEEKSEAEAKDEK